LVTGLGPLAFLQTTIHGAKPAVHAAVTMRQSISTAMLR
jgi:hypothetical protein